MTKAKNYWTDTAILDLPADPTKPAADHLIAHPRIHRFFVRIRDGKPHSYIMMFSQHGKPQKFTIGRVGTISLTKAEAAAGVAWGGLKSSENYKNPNVERKRMQAVHSDMFETHIDQFLKDQQRDGNTPAWTERQGVHLREYFKAFHGTPIKLIDRGMISNALKKIVEGWTDPATGRRRGGLIASTNARATLETYFNWLIGEGCVKGLEYNPVEKTKKYASKKKTRWLTPDEIKIVWDAAGEDTQFGRIIRLLILTGARREQIGGLRKSELELAKAMITLPPKGVREGGSKNDQAFEIPLSRQAVRLLELEASPAGKQFFGNGKGEGGFSGWSKAMVGLNKRIGDRITIPWTLHDLRRTFVTNMAQQLKLPPHVVDACINHKPEFKQGVAGVYQQADMLVERVAAMSQWGDWIERVTTPAPKKPDLRIVA
jgi:integrase